MLAECVLDRLLDDDVPHGDLTTRQLGIGGSAGRMRFYAREAMVLAAIEDAARMIVRCGAAARSTAASGDPVAAGDLLLEAEGAAAALHRAWKSAQTLVEYASGVATATQRIVAAARAVAPAIVVECTRKAVPGTRAIAVEAVLAGGAGMHRLGLSESLLVFPEHLAFLASDADLARVFDLLKRHNPGRRLTAEAPTPAEALRLAAAGCDIIQVDKFSPEAVRGLVEAVRAHAPPPLIAAAGGIDATNAADYAATGCAVLVTSAPYWAKPADVRVTLEPG